ncbi:MAG: DUF1501 domain-containing protein [Polyangiaceae bacterium]
MKFSRRRFLEIGTAATGGLLLNSVFTPTRTLASEEDPQLLLFCYFQGGWDQMLAFDPRPNDAPQFQLDAASKAGGTSIAPVYQLLAEKRVTDVLLTNPSGVQQAGNLTFGPAVPKELLQHAPDLALIRGILMGTLTHDVGKRYFITGKFPRGVTANGSAMSTVVAAAEGSQQLIPNLAISHETYNEGFPSFASGINVNSADDVLNLIRPIGKLLSPSSDTALMEYELNIDNCERRGYNADGMVDLFMASRAKARTMTDPEGYGEYFKFALPPPPQLEDIFNLFKVNSLTAMKDARGKTAMAALALSLGISQSVSVEIARDLDDHGDWAENQGTTMYDGLERLGNLITYLKNTEYKKTGKSTWSHTTLVAFSEFARTPLPNGRNGRDHHQSSSCMVAGPKIRGNVVIGGTDDNNMTARLTNFETGLPDDGGNIVRPTDIHATLLHSMGLDYGHLSNLSPQLISALLKA